MSADLEHAHELALAHEALRVAETERDDWKRTAEMVAEECGEHMARADAAEERNTHGQGNP